MEGEIAAGHWEPIFPQAAHAQKHNLFRHAWSHVATPTVYKYSKGGLHHFSRNLHFFCTCHNFFPLSSVQIIIIPACCLLCVL